MLKFRYKFLCSGNVLSKAFCTALTFTLLVCFGSGPRAEGLPRTFGWTAYGTTSSGYAVSVAIGNALADDGYRLRVIPAKNDISRLTPLRAKRVQFAATGIGSYLAQEGVNDFGTRRWGPQKLRLIMMSWSNTNTVVAAATKDTGVKTVQDLAGKRVVWVIGAPALNMNMEGVLAFGDLDWSDVTRVVVGGQKAAMQGLIEGTIDAAIASTNTSALYQLAGSPRGLYFIPKPHDDVAGWHRMNLKAPWIKPSIGTAGVDLSVENPLEGGSYGYPILITYATRDEQMAYDLAKLIHINYEEFKDAHSSGVGFAMERQVFDWIVPYHDGAVQYFREIGVWTEKHQVHNDGLVARQDTLSLAWNEFLKKDIPEEIFYEEWLRARFVALSEAGMDTIWGE